MDLSSFFNSLSKALSDEEVLDFCRKHILHGTPYVFHSKDEDFYEFRKK